MKQRTLLYHFMLLVCLLVWGAGSAWGDSYTITFANNSNSAAALEATTNASTVISDDGSRSYVTAKPFTINSGNCYYGDTKSCIRIGKTGTSSSLSIALSATGSVKATGIVVNCENTGGNKNSDAKLNVNSLGQQTTTTTASNYTFTFGSATDITSITLAGTASIRIYSITVNYSSGPTINASNVNIDADATAGSIAYSITDPVSGGALTAAETSASGWWTGGEVSASAVAFTTTANTGAQRSTTVRLTYTYNTNQTVTKDVTVTQAAPVAKHTVTVDDGIENGTVTLKRGDDDISSGDEVPEGATVTVVLTADEDYKFVDGNLIVYTSGDEVETTKVDATHYTFEMPTDDVNIDATFTAKVYYNINIVAMTNGSVESDPATRAEEGETVTLTATPATDYTLNTIAVTDEDEGNVSLTGTGNTRTFTMPAKAVTVTATFNQPKGSIGNPYTIAEVDGSTGTISSVYITGYIVGSISGNKYYKSVNQLVDTNAALADDPSISFTEGAGVVSTTDGLIPIEFGDKRYRANYGGDTTDGAMLGTKVLIKGNLESYYGTRGVKNITQIITEGSYTTSQAISSTSDIPNYNSDANVLYYVKHTSSITDAANVVKETDDGTCTAEEIKITDGVALNIPTDVTADKITNSRTLAADADAYTWYEPYAYTLPEGNVAYTFTGANGTALTFTETGSQTLAANTPYLIVAADAVNGSVNSSTVVKATPTTNTSGGTQGNWQFVGTYKTMTATEAEAANMWALGAGNKWFYYTGSDAYGVYPRRAYMINSADKASAKQFDSNFDTSSEATHIELVNSKNPKESRIYTLDGKYVGTKKELLNGGIYVKDGKKFIIK